MLKEVISATYLIQQDNALKELAQDIDALYAKAKKMMPNIKGVPIGEVSRASETKRADLQKLTETPLGTDRLLRPRWEGGGGGLGGGTIF